MANLTKSRLSPAAEFTPSVFITPYSFLERNSPKSKSYSTNRLGPIRIGVRGPGFKQSKVLSTTRKQLQKILDFPSRSSAEVDVCPFPTGNDGFSSLESEFTHTYSYSKLLQNSPESFRQFRPIHDVQELTKSVRKPKTLKTLGVIRGIKPVIQAKKSDLETGKGSKSSEFRDYKSTDRRGAVAKSRILIRKRGTGNLVAEKVRQIDEEDHSDPDDSSPWPYLPSKYSPLVR